jgi:protein tyrosine phosphatase (PTP) superfamily phosphohydrolase (DUF442 family)
VTRLVVLLGAVIAGVNLLIAAVSVLVRLAARPAAPSAAGVRNLREVDERVLCGSAPSSAGYCSLARLGVTTVVDLRAERPLVVPEALLQDLGMVRESLPIRDGQTPTAAQVHRFTDVVASSRGRVYLHCGAGVGRSGSMAAAYLAGTDQASGWQALRRTLAVGPPSLEQTVYVAMVRRDRLNGPPLAVRAASRLLDGPRRVRARLRD